MRPYKSLDTTGCLIYREKRQSPRTEECSWGIQGFDFSPTRRKSDFRVREYSPDVAGFYTTGHLITTSSVSYIETLARAPSKTDLPGSPGIETRLAGQRAVVHGTNAPNIPAFRGGGRVIRIPLGRVIDRSFLPLRYLSR